MKANKIFFILIIYSMLIAEKIAAQGPVHVSWSEAAVLPDLKGEKQLGVAGPFAGVSNGVMLIAGGSNFPGAKPWNGGKKVNRDDIYVLKKLPGNKFQCSVLKQHLVKRIAYGASVTTSFGIVCIGGETDEAGSTSSAFIMQWDEAKRAVNFAPLPSLPIHIVNACASCIDNTVYVFGGESDGHPVDRCFKLDLNAKAASWKSLATMPLTMSHSAAVMQSNGRNPCIFIVGGRSSTASGISNLHNCTLCYNPVTNQWSTMNAISDGSTTTNLSACAAAAVGDRYILVAGGDKGDIFHKIESYNAAIAKTTNDEQQGILQNEKLQLVTHHPGFSRDIYLYDTIANKWKKLGKLPFYAQVTTRAVKWGNEILIPGGEIMPGTRTATITMGIISK